MNIKEHIKINDFYYLLCLKKTYLWTKRYLSIKLTVEHKYLFSHQTKTSEKDQNNYRLHSVHRIDTFCFQ